MTFNQLLFLFAFYGISLHTVYGQLDSHNHHSNNVAGSPEVQIQDDTVDVDAEDPDDEADVVTRLGEVSSLQEFISLMQINGRQVTDNDVFDNLVDEENKTVIRGGGRLAVSDNCSPRNTTIRITMEGTDSNVAFFPRCTKIERCGGCCSSPHLECIPQYTERVELKVLKGQVPFPGATHLEFTGFDNVIVDRHVTCRVACTLTADKCGPKKRFLRQRCACKCNRFTPCRPPTMWDPEDCTCKCPQVEVCCPNGDDCGMVFNPTQCMCEISNGGRININADSNNTNPDVLSNQPARPTPVATTTTTTTTTTASTTLDPCLTRVCPPRFVKVRRGDLCQCRPPSMVGGRRRGRQRG